jgi:hypothetical protein
MTEDTPDQTVDRDAVVDLQRTIRTLEAARQAERDHGKRQALGIELY